MVHPSHKYNRPHVGTVISYYNTDKFGVHCSGSKIFAGGWGANPQIGHWDTIIKFSRKPHEIEKKIGRYGETPPPPSPSFDIDYYAPKSVCVHAEHHVRT